VNREHLPLLDAQRRRRGSEGFVVTNPNCSATGLTMVLAPLEERFGISSLVIATLQAVSGAGYPGLPSLDILDNAIPFIAGEEEKLEREPKKMLGRLSAGGERIDEARFPIAAMVHRVPTTDGHLVSGLVTLKEETTPETIVRAFADWSRERALDLPSAPKVPLLHLEAPDRPQTRLDRDLGRGMTTSVGRVRSSQGGGFRFACLAHNTLRGAAGASVLNAELLVSEGWVS
jgi:aspartate-semialdehyde dehydrogenase